jgi:roadblock/LC7 domain-containing protein
LFTAIEDTMPLNTIDPVDAIINPLNIDVDSALLTPTAGTRYLLTDNVGSAENQFYSEWGEIVAYQNDIIEYNGSQWTVVFNSAANDQIEYVTNTNTNTQYRWTGEEWVKSVEGVYRGGEWSLII